MKKVSIFILYLGYILCNLHPWMAMFFIIIFAIVFAFTTKKELKKDKEFKIMAILFWTSIVTLIVSIILHINWVEIFTNL